MLKKADSETELDHLRGYVAQLLGTRLDIEAAPTKGLPGFIADLYQLFTTRILQSHCLLLLPRATTIDTPGAVAKHVALLRRDHPDRIVILVAPKISTHNRQRLIAQHVPFIVPGNQMFVPDLAIDLREHFRQTRNNLVERLSPAAQLVVLAALLDGLTGGTPGELAARLRYSAMSMSRAVDELDVAGLITTETSGKFRHFRFTDDGPTLWRRALPLLRNPVRKRRTVRWHIEVVNLPLAGDSALARYTDLAPPALEVHALPAADWAGFARAHRLEETPGWNEQRAEIETWSYDPTIIGGGVIDPLSLWLSLPDNPDERFAQAKDQLLKEAGL